MENSSAPILPAARATTFPASDGVRLTIDPAHASPLINTFQVIGNLK